MKTTVAILKNTIIIFLLFALLSSLCSCQIDTTIFMSEDQRAEYLTTQSNKYFDPYKQHASYDISVRISDGSQTDVYVVQFEDYYDTSDESNIKYFKKETRNDIAGYAESFTHTDNFMYISSDQGNIRVKMSDTNEFYSYLSLYSVPVNQSFFVYIKCPKMSNGEYIMTQDAATPDRLTGIYNDVAWAIPSHLYDKLCIKSYRDVNQFDSSGRLLSTTVYIQIHDPSTLLNDQIIITQKKTYHYEDFEITAPDNANSYHLLNDYGAATDVINFMNQYLNEESGVLDCSFEVKLSGAIQDQFIESNRLTYSTSSKGVLTYDMISEIQAHDAPTSQARHSYDGELLIIESEGRRQQSPTSQEEAYVTLAQYKDFLWLYYGAFDAITDYSLRDNSLQINFDLTRAYTASLFENELFYYFGIEPDDGTLTSSGHCAVTAINENYGYVADEVIFVGEASFKMNGENINVTYTYKLNVVTHENEHQ